MTHDTAANATAPGWATVCVTCGYAMHGASGQSCPECGRPALPAAHVDEIKRSLRRWAALLGVAGVLSAPLLLLPTGLAIATGALTVVGLVAVLLPLRHARRHMASWVIAMGTGALAIIACAGMVIWATASPAALDGLPDLAPAVAGVTLSCLILAPVALALAWIAVPLEHMTCRAHARAACMAVIAGLGLVAAGIGTAVVQNAEEALLICLGSGLPLLIAGGHLVTGGIELRRTDA